MKRKIIRSVQKPHEGKADNSDGMQKTQESEKNDAFQTKRYQQTRSRYIANMKTPEMPYDEFTNALTFSAYARKKETEADQDNSSFTQER